MKLGDIYQLAIHAGQKADPRGAERLRQLLEEATQRRLVHGARTGLLLSGGLDSSLVGALVLELPGVLERSTVAVDELQFASEKKVPFLGASNKDTDCGPSVTGFPSTSRR